MVLAMMMERARLYADADGFSLISCRVMQLKWFPLGKEIAASFAEGALCIQVNAAWLLPWLSAVPRFLVSTPRN
jgi:hypothetical protein